MPIRKKPKIEIKDISGKKISFKKFKEGGRENILKNTIAKKDVLKREILTKSKLEKAVKEGLLREIVFDDQIYFNQRELTQYVERMMGFATGDNQFAEIEELYKEKRKLWEKEHEIDKQLKSLTRNVSLEDKSHKSICIEVIVINTNKDNKFRGWEIDKSFYSMDSPMGKPKLDLKVLDEAIDCLKVMRGLYEVHADSPEFKEILSKELDRFGVNRLEWYLRNLERDGNQ